jgi:CelD/BcsL family acetyltransferase involved in cellulose biosynthesis
MTASAASQEVVLTRLETVEAMDSSWNRLAVAARSPFLTHQWVRAWSNALGTGALQVGLLHAPDGSLQAGACWQRSFARAVTSPTDPAYGYAWDVVAEDDAGRRAIWNAIAGTGAARMCFTPIREEPGIAGVAREVLEANGYRTVRTPAEASPYLPLPTSWDALLSSVSRKLRHQWRSSRRLLDADGGLRLRTTRDQADLDRDLDVFLRLEASGWKGRAGTAILCDARAVALFRDFARAAARQGWLRLSILEIAGTPIAAAYSCVFAGKAFRLKSAFDERLADRSPGLVLLGEELRLSIEEGLDEFDFLGAPDPHKLRWGAQTRPWVTLRAYQGATGVPAYGYRAHMRPALGRLRRRTRAALRRGVASR